MLRGKRGGMLLFALITLLVAGGLGWATHSALELERAQRDGSQVRLALWRLDSRIAPILAREDSRPYYHFSAVYAPELALNNEGVTCAPGSVLEVSPLVVVDMPDWIVLHFQADGDSGWSSPRVLSEQMSARLTGLARNKQGNVTEQRLLDQFASRLPAAELLKHIQADLARSEATQLQLAAEQRLNEPIMQMAQGPANPNPAGQRQEYLNRAGSKIKVQQETQSANSPSVYGQGAALNNTRGNGEAWFTRSLKLPTEKAEVRLTPMSPVWTDAEDYLVMARRVTIGDKEICQGLLLDWKRLQQVLIEEVEDLYPQARFIPQRDPEPARPELTMTALPVELIPGPVALETPFWTPLRVGLACAWLAALIALAAVGLGGWSLLELSERRIGFVSAVTHELRTPMTTLRLYLDMLAGGMVKEEAKKTEYLQTLNEEADRLDRLIGNVLDFSRLERQKPHIDKSATPAADMIEQVHAAWQSRCQSFGKELVLENKVDDLRVSTDARYVQQILSSLIDNACKYSRGADDSHIWLRAVRAGNQVVFEVEDRGPGIAAKEQRSIFRAFRRGLGTETTGGVGLGLALAQRWARLLNGSLSVKPTDAGACFRLSLPI